MYWVGKWENDLKDGGCLTLLQTWRPQNAFECKCNDLRKCKHTVNQIWSNPTTFQKHPSGLMDVQVLDRLNEHGLICVALCGSVCGFWTFCLVSLKRTEWMSDTAGSYRDVGRCHSRPNSLFWCPESYFRCTRSLARAHMQTLPLLLCHIASRQQAVQSASFCETVLTQCRCTHN